MKPTANHMPPIDFAKLEREITQTPLPPLEYTPPVRPVAHTAVQIIAHGITQLRWKEAEAMGTAVAAKVKDGSSMTAAIQAWAEEWESFK